MIILYYSNKRVNNGHKNSKKYTYCIVKIAVCAKNNNNTPHCI